MKIRLFCLNLLMPDGNKRSYKLKQLLVCLSMYELLLPTDFKEFGYTVKRDRGLQKVKVSRTILIFP